MKSKIQSKLILLLLQVVVLYFISCSNERSECENKVYRTFGDDISCLFFIDSVNSKSGEISDAFFLVTCLGTKIGLEKCRNKSEYKPQLGDW